MKSMKHYLLALLTLAIIFAISILPVSAVESTAALNASYGSPVVDGVVDDLWKDVAVAELTKESLAHFPDTDSETTGKLKTMWDENYFYILVEVDKHGVNYLWQNGAYDLAGNDTVCLSLSLNGNFTAAVYGGSPYCGGDMRSYDGGTTILSGGWIVTENNTPDNGYSVKWQQKAVSGTTDQYVVEAAFPWADIAVQAGNTVGLEVCINSIESGSTSADAVRAGIIWAAEDQMYWGWQSGDALGKVTLLAKPEPPVTTVPPANTADPEGSETPDDSGNADTGSSLITAMILCGVGITTVLSLKKRKEL